MEADLHLHTCLSDGTYSPAELVRQAHLKQFAAIAAVDHDTFAAIPELLRAGAATGVEVIPGVEITTQVDAREVHILGYFGGDRWQAPALAAVLVHAQQLRAQRVAQFVARFHELGIELSVADVESCADGGTLGRPHVALALVKRGVVPNTDEAFARFLKRGRPGFVDRYRMPAKEAIHHIRAAGGVAVLAHPALTQLGGRLQELVDQGLEGLEAWHCKQTPAQTERYLALARELNILVTGGSDCHGPRRGECLLGTIRVPYQVVAALKERLAAKP
jgi:3',5'-nucleoside bisphosphate phosphatase